MKPSCCLGLDEDEGFSDWTHRLENRVQVKEGREEDGEEEGRSLEASPSEKVPADAWQKLCFFLSCRYFLCLLSVSDIRHQRGDETFARFRRLPASRRRQDAGLRQLTSRQDVPPGDGVTVCSPPPAVVVHFYVESHL